MAPAPQTLAGIAFLFVLVFLFGFWLTRTGKPYNGIVLTIHKLIALAALAILAITIYRTAKQTELSAAIWIAGVASGLFFVVAIVSGGLLSTDKTLPPAIKLLHRVSPFLIVLSTAATPYAL